MQIDPVVMEHVPHGLGHTRIGRMAATVREQGLVLEDHQPGGSAGSGVGQVRPDPRDVVGLDVAGRRVEGDDVARAGIERVARRPGGPITIGCREVDGPVPQILAELDLVIPPLRCEGSAAGDGSDLVEPGLDRLLTGAKPRVARLVA
jgi:hypothetical protein